MGPRDLWLLGVIFDPVNAMLLLVLACMVIHLAAIGVIPAGLRRIARRRRIGKLTLDLRLRLETPGASVPRPLREELAQLLISEGRASDALSAIKPSAVAGHHDAVTLFLLGSACYSAGHPDEAEVFLTEARSLDPLFRSGAIDLELGRGRLRHGRARAAVEVLDHYLRQNPHSIEGSVLLARALMAAGEGSEANAVRREAWARYSCGTPEEKRRDRWWAFRVKPQRPAIYAATFIMLAALLGQQAFAKYPSMTNQNCPPVVHMQPGGVMAAGVGRPN